MEKIKVDLNITSSDEILEEMYREYLTCNEVVKELARMGLTDQQIRDNIAKVYDYVVDVKYCSKCPGVDKCQKENPLFNTKISYHNGFVDREVSPCKKFLQRVEFQNQFLVRDFDDDHLDVSLRNIEDTMVKNEIISRYFEFRDKKINNWMYITGMANTGKSFVATAIAVDVAKKKLGPIIYADSNKRIAELTELYFKDKEKFKRDFDRYCTVPVLILDDFGNEVKTDLIRDAIIFPLLSTRASKRLFTIIVSDFTISDVVALYSTSKAGEIRAKQIGSIIKNVAGKEINLGDIVAH